MATPLRLATLFLAPFVFSISSSVLAQSDTSIVVKSNVLEVHKSSTCGCCSGWVEHIEKQGFKTTVYHDNDLNKVKSDAGIPANMRSCHTALSKEGYVFEGHIPAKFVEEFLANPPQGAKGLVVPAMPVGSPGMEYNNQFMSYSVLQLNEDGSVSPYAEINRIEDQY